MKPVIFLEIDWEEKMIEAHKMPAHIRKLPKGQGNREPWDRLRGTLRARIKEIKKLIVAGVAVYK